MDLVDTEKNQSEPVTLRLVSDSRAPQTVPKLEKQFVNFIFLRVNSDWRKLTDAEKRESKDEFTAIYRDYQKKLLLFSYSLVGFDSKADLMFWRIGESLDLIQEMTAKFFRTGLGSYIETSDNYLSVTKKKMFVMPENIEDRFHVAVGEKKYLFVYPCAKNREWYDKTSEERENLIEESFMVGKKFSNIKIHLTNAFGFSEQEFIVLFETDEPKDFLAFTEELSQTSASKMTLRGTPIYTCRQRGLTECLDALG